MVLGPRFYYQKIVDSEGKVVGLELLARGVPVSPYTDVFLFYSAMTLIEKVDDVVFHVNIYSNSINYISWDKVLFLKDRLVIEIIEDDIIKNIDSVKKLKELGFKIALDDFGKGHSNFALLSQVDFDIVKIDVEYTPKEVIEFLRRNNNNFLVVAEKAGIGEVPADAFQSYKVHYPEPVTNLFFLTNRNS